MQKNQSRIIFNGEWMMGIFSTQCREAARISNLGNKYGARHYVTELSKEKMQRRYKDHYSQRRTRSIARDSWEAYWREKVPVGWHVHHFDGNPQNNDICNLLAIPESDHHHRHLCQQPTCPSCGKFIQLSAHFCSIECEKKYTDKKFAWMEEQHEKIKSLIKPPAFIIEVGSKEKKHD